MTDKTKKIEDKIIIESEFPKDSKHYLCPSCHTFPKLIFKENRKVYFYCKEINGGEMEIDNYMEYKLTKGDIKEIALSDSNNDYIGYCYDCKINFSNNQSNNHKDHDIKYFKDIYKEKLNFIKNKLSMLNINKEDSKPGSFISTNQNNKIGNNNKSERSKDIEKIKVGKKNYLVNRYTYSPFLDLIKIIIQDLEKYPNNNIHYENIKNIFYFLSDQMEIEYYYNYENQSLDIRIFGENFVKNNVDNFVLFIDETEEKMKEEKWREEKLKEKDKIKDPNKPLKIKLIKINETEDLSEMFYKCDCLSEINIINNKWDTSNLKKMSGMFYGCKALKKLPEISKWETNKITDFSSIFEGCENLESLPDISNWNVENVKNMSNMFNGCESLEGLPNLSKWKTNNLETIHSMFQNCKNLKNLEGIKHWDTSNVVDMSYAFQNCCSLTELDDISKWNTEKVTSFSNMFAECESLIQLPDLSTWETQNAKKMNYMFSNCKKLKTISDISKWNVQNVIYMNNMFENCSSLKFFPDISKWQKNKNLDTCFMFKGCDSLKEIPNLNN